MTPQETNKRIIICIVVIMSTIVVGFGAKLISDYVKFSRYSDQEYYHTALPLLTKGIPDYPQTPEDIKATRLEWIIDKQSILSRAHLLNDFSSDLAQPGKFVRIWFTPKDSCTRYMAEIFVPQDLKNAEFNYNGFPDPKEQSDRGATLPGWDLELPRCKSKKRFLAQQAERLKAEQAASAPQEALRDDTALSETASGPVEQPHSSVEERTGGENHEND